MTDDNLTTVFKCMEFRAYRNAEQKILSWKTIGCERFVWNHLLAEHIEFEKDNRGKLLNFTPAHLKKEHGFLNEVDSLALANVQLDLNKACRKMFAKGKTPAFRAKGRERRSYTTNCVNGNIEIVRVSDRENYIKLPKLGRVKIILHRDIPAEWRMKHVTVKETASGKFFVSIVFEADIVKVERKEKPEKIEAFDYSMPSLVVSASGRNDIRSEDIHWYRNLEEKLAREQRRLSRMQYGSHNYWEQRHKIGRIYEKAAARRKDYLNKFSHAVAEEFDAVIVEDIDLQAMAKALKFGKSVHDNGFGMLRRMLAYKLADRGKVLVKVDRFYPSSRRCSSCGYINTSLTLSDRSWTCPECSAFHDRERNACANLIEEGRNIISRWTSGDSSLILPPQGVLSEKKLHTLSLR